MPWLLMARPKAEHPPAGAIRALVDREGRLAVRVTPGARSEGIEIADGRVQVKVCAHPENGKATAAVSQLLAQALGVPASQLILLRGATSREKQFMLPAEV